MLIGIHRQPQRDHTPPGVARSQNALHIIDLLAATQAGKSSIVCRAYRLLPTPGGVRGLVAAACGYLYGHERDTRTSNVSLVLVCDGYSKRVSCPKLDGYVYGESWVPKRSTLSFPFMVISSHRQPRRDPLPHRA